MHQPQEGYDMESMDNFRERFETLEQQTEQLKHQTQALARQTRWWRSIACGVGLLSLLSLPLSSGIAKDDDKEKENERLERRVKVLEAKLAAVTFDASNYEIVITGANLRIVNGLGST